MGQQGYANVHSDCKGLGAAQVAPGSPHEQAAYEVSSPYYHFPPTE